MQLLPVSDFSLPLSVFKLDLIGSLKLAMWPVTGINWSKYDDAIPAFLALILILLTYSITQGIVWGFLSWTVIKFFTGKKEEVTPALLVIDALAILSLIL